jgi:phage shock protein E
MQEIAQRVGELPKDRPLVLYCGSGVRSGKVAQFLRQAGFSDVTNAGGLGDMPR